jgi:hypothetical protein
MKSLYAALWIGWLTLFCVIEGSAFIMHRYDLTLSDFVWRFEGLGWTAGRYAVAAFLVWLAGHLAFGWWR